MQKWDYFRVSPNRKYDCWSNDDAAWLYQAHKIREAMQTTRLQIR